MKKPCPRCGGTVHGKRGVDPLPFHLTTCPAVPRKKEEAA